MFGLDIWSLIGILVALAGLYIWWRVMKYIIKKISWKSDGTNDDFSKE